MQPWISGLLRCKQYAGMWLAVLHCALASAATLPVGLENTATVETVNQPLAATRNKREPRSQSSQSLNKNTSADNKRPRVTLTPPDSEAAGTIASKGLRGKASFYGAKFNGRKTATGEIFNNKLFTAASNLLPLGSLVMVKRPDTNLCVVVKVNDRMHSKHQSRVIDLSHSAAKYLDMVREGIVKVQIVPLPASATEGSTIDCAMGFELEETCSDCNAPPLQFNDTVQ